MAGFIYVQFAAYTIAKQREHPLVLTTAQRLASVHHQAHIEDSSSLCHLCRTPVTRGKQPHKHTQAQMLWGAMG